MGPVEVPMDALYGAQTQRAVHNFPISRLRFQRGFLRALGLIKSAAARINGQLGHLSVETAKAVEAAAESVVEGAFDSEFVVDVFQSGSGTSTNMNCNEVIARLASIRSNTVVHPNDHVNRAQSSNDVIPSAMQIAAAESIHGALLPAMEMLRAVLERKSSEFDGFVKTGRTHLQDAVPVRLGQEFHGYATQVRYCVGRVNAALPGIFALPLGGTAVGTGLNAPRGFAQAVVAIIAERTGLPFQEAEDHFEAQSARDAILFLSGGLRTYAIALTKIANDIRWMGSGPRNGLGELRVPAIQPGSSIMPGKVNPVIAESLLMVCAQVIGHDAAILWCCAGGNFELNTMMPLMVYDVLESIQLLAAATRNFALRCVDGLEADRDRIETLTERSLSLATALAPEIGYDKAAEIAEKAHATGRTVREVARQVTGLPDSRLDQLLNSLHQTGPSD